MAGVLAGPITWSGGADESGFREYDCTLFIKADYGDGPNTVSQTPGLPVVGSRWLWEPAAAGHPSDFDPKVWCRSGVQFKPYKQPEASKFKYWAASYKFSNKPEKADSSQTKCQDGGAGGNPLLEPQKISGSFQKTTEEAVFDRFGGRIRNSAHEQLRGPQMEFDRSTPQVVIEQNVANLDLGFVTGIRDHVNNGFVWGVPPRCLKFGDFTWEKKYYGSCFAYYTRKFTFDVNYKTWDRTVIDEGTKVIHGRWGKDGEWEITPVGYTGLGTGAGTGTGPRDRGESITPDPNNPKHFIRFKDRNGENSTVILNGRGSPIGVDVKFGTGFTEESPDVGTGTAFHEDRPGEVFVSAYPGTNFFALGIPTSL